MLIHFEDQPEQLYCIDRKTADELSIIASQRNTTLKSILKDILTKLYTSQYRSVYVAFCDSYSIFSRAGYATNYTDEICEDLTDAAGIVAFKNDEEPELLTGIFDMTGSYEEPEPDQQIDLTELMRQEYYEDMRREYLSYYL
jgi:hypothetical protein